MKFRTLSILLAVGVVAHSSAGLGQNLPKGARQISEAYEGWTLKCGADKSVAAGATTCSVNRTEQIAPKSRASISIALKPHTDGSIKGTLIVPFGLDFSKGVVTELDGKAIGSTLQFRTCMPAGCFLPVEWATAIAKQIRAGQKLRLVGTSVDAKPIAVTIATKGLGDALDRASTLMPK